MGNRPTRGHHLFGAGLLLVLTLLLTVLGAGKAWAETFTVTNTDDSGAGSLREAIEQANATAGADGIVFADGVSGTIALRSQLPTVTDSAGLSIDGGGGIAVSGNHAVRPFEVAVMAELDLKNLTITDGMGGGILNGGTLRVFDSTIVGNSAHVGGGITNGQGDFLGTLIVRNSTISGNSAYSGGGIAHSGARLRVTNSTISGNSATFGGGIYNSGSFVDGAEVTNSSISGNSAVGGAGITNIRKLTVTNATIASNRSQDLTYGVGIDNGSYSDTTVSNTILADNGGVNGIKTCNVGPEYRVTDSGYNISDDDTCGFSEANHSLSNTDPLLDPDGLQDNGGPTSTIALLPESPAVDLVGEETCPPPATDQRGVERPQGEACDAGAFELVQEPPQPRSKGECKKGGYKDFGFKNQGRCVAFVNRAANTR